MGTRDRNAAVGGGYQNDQAVRANLIVATTHNYQAMNDAVRQVAKPPLDGTTLTEGLRNHIEIAIRCIDPCPSCATHVQGKMPLEVEVVDAGGTAIDGIRRDSAACAGFHAPLGSVPFN